MIVYPPLNYGNGHSSSCPPCHCCWSIDNMKCEGTEPQYMSGLWTPMEKLCVLTLYLPFQSGFQSGTYLDVHPKFHQGYPITTAGNMQTMPAPCQHYGAGQNAYTILTSEDGGVFSKGGGTCSVQQTVGFIAQHKVDFYHSYPGSVEYPGSKTGDGCNFHHSATMGAPFPTAASHHLYHS